MKTNIAVSVRARLANQAKASQRPLRELLQYYGLERFLYRFALSPHRNRFLLKVLRLVADRLPVRRYVRAPVPVTGVPALAHEPLLMPTPRPRRVWTRRLRGPLADAPRALYSPR